MIVGMGWYPSGVGGVTGELVQKYSYTTLKTFIMITGSMLSPKVLLHLQDLDVLCYSFVLPMTKTIL